MGMQSLGASKYSVKKKQESNKTSNQCNPKFPMENVSKGIPGDSLYWFFHEKFVLLVQNSVGEINNLSVEFI